MSSAAVMVILSCLVFSVWAAFVGAFCGLVISRYTYPVLDYDVARTGLFILGILCAYEWLVRFPTLFFVYHSFFRPGAWVQVWIAAFAAGSMVGYSWGRQHWRGPSPIPIRAGLIIKDEGIILVDPEVVLPKKN